MQKPCALMWTPSESSQGNPGLMVSFFTAATLLVAQDTTQQTSAKDIPAQSNELNVRNPNDRNPQEIRTPKPEASLGELFEKVCGGKLPIRSVSGFGVRISFGSRISNFGIRESAMIFAPRVINKSPDDCE